MELLVAGIALIVGGIVLYVIRRAQRAKLFEIAATEKSTARGLADLAKKVAEEMGESGNFVQTVAINGIAKCDTPLSAEIGKAPCVYYESTVNREYEETYTETDSSTKQQVQRTRRASEIMASNKQGVAFWVEDTTGRIMVEPRGAKIETVQVVNRFEPSASLADGVLSFGDFRLALGGMLPGAGSRTLGYRLSERILPLDRRVFVLGEASDATGEVVIQAPREKGKRFIIALKSSEELIRSTASAIRWLQLAMIASWAAGIALVASGLIVRR